MVQEKCKRINYKLKKRIKNDKSEWIRIDSEFVKFSDTKGLPS